MDEWAGRLLKRTSRHLSPGSLASKGIAFIAGFLSCILPSSCDTPSVLLPWLVVPILLPHSLHLRPQAETLSPSPSPINRRKNLQIALVPSAFFTYAPVLVRIADCTARFSCETVKTRSNACSVAHQSFARLWGLEKATGCPYLHLPDVVQR